MQYTRTVEALKQGTVIDHIPAGQGLTILRLFKLSETGERVTVGLNLSSRHMGAKDIIKVENIALSEEQANELALFAPQADAIAEWTERHADDGDDGEFDEADAGDDEHGDYAVAAE